MKSLLCWGGLNIKYARQWRADWYETGSSEGWGHLQGFVQVLPAPSPETDSGRSLVYGGEQLVARSLAVPPTEIRYLGFTTLNHTEIYSSRHFVLAVGKGTLCVRTAVPVPQTTPLWPWQLLLRLTQQGYCLPFLQGCKNTEEKWFCFTPHAVFKVANWIWDWKLVSVSFSQIKPKAQSAMASCCIPSAISLGKRSQSFACCQFVEQLLELLCKVTAWSIAMWAVNQLPALTPLPLNGSWNKGKWRERNKTHPFKTGDEGQKGQ